VPRGGIEVSTHLLSVDGITLIVGYPANEDIDLAAISSALGAIVFFAMPDELPLGFRGAHGSIPPLGQLFGVPVLLDERITLAPVLVFRAFDESAYFEIPFADYARLEQPRIASFASAGELIAAATAP
jgi:Ala-tRNA(Pro) deacylase